MVFYLRKLEGVELAVGTSGTYAPFSYFADDGTTLQGYDVAMLEELQKMLKHNNNIAQNEL